MNNFQQIQQNEQQQTIPTHPYMFQNPHQHQYQYNPQYQQQYQPNHTIFTTAEEVVVVVVVAAEFFKRKYCWTNGLCGHNGRECSNPAQGHQADATLENHMGGNTYNVNA